MKQSAFETKTLWERFLVAVFTKTNALMLLVVIMFEQFDLFKVHDEQVKTDLEMDLINVRTIYTISFKRISSKATNEGFNI